ncbi:unnamed protein product [Thlaspi arvense]|uniref:Bifunctional inhibitor/plant lipid transfer protein/seed storage helical domain-containing protein n=1 Tax=Thlaspi arvense TaxID=13288 RepID=A0AAU9T0X8_THLAR|nr:unnamed protein product [Thlaspi arvense]
MANKLFLVCATLALCVLLSNASIYRTVVELEEDDATNQLWPFPFPQGRPQQKCQREFQKHQRLQGCQRWIRNQIGQSPFDENEGQQGPQPQQDQPAFEQCCRELRRVDPDCVCPSLKKAAKAVSLRGQEGPFRTSRIYRTARDLPRICEVEGAETCPFLGIPFLPPY